MCIRDSIVAGLRRELQEELGKEIVIGDPFAAFTYNNDIKRSHSIEVVYFANFKDSTEGISINPADHSGYDWITEDQLNLVAQNKVRGKEDEEYIILDKAFKLLRGESLIF
jgi:ADP-ribose pyrophosphatase YjhB (NUDIX family)